MSIIYDSILLAINRHKCQKYGHDPYINHLFSVYLLCSKYTKSKEVRASAILHDILEDTDTSINELKNISNDVSDICILLSKKHNTEYYKNISANHKASFVKIADRICNIKESIESKNIPMLLKYQKEIEYYSLLNNNFTEQIYNKEFIPILNKLNDVLNNH